jgi:hypothetical protein
MRTLIAITCLLLLSSCYFLGPSPAKRYRKSVALRPFDAVIVPGLPFNDGKWDTLVKTRIMWAVYLYQKGITKNIIFSGNAVYTPYMEGKAMAIYARALGVDAAHIFTDTLAEHSTENVYYSYEIAKANGFKNVALATDPFQSYMLHKYSRKHFKNTIYLLPVVYDSIETMMRNEPIADTRPAFVENFTSIKDKQTTSQRLRASKGKRLKYKE